MEIDHNSYAMPSAATCSKQVGRYTKLQHLKVVKMEGFSNEEDEILFVERLRDVAAVEPLILATSDGICFRNLAKVHSHDEYQYMQQPDKTRPVSQEKYFYKFVQVKNINELCPKHAHMSL